ncbi:MAG: PQQ-dependent sugar dehydrogenase [Flavobacteriales bacterium]|nr:PQQ-dependent sugar dehydrogenase [Flavobacteriales bacterium]
MKFARMLSISLLMVSILFACAEPQGPENQDPVSTDVNYELVVDGLSIPWAMAWLPDGSMLITERDGRLIQFKDGKKTEIGGIPVVVARGQGGLLDICLHPEYASNGWIYLTYSSPDGEERGAHTALMRCKLEGTSLTDQEILYKGSPNTSKGHHFGSRIVFDNDGYLYFSIGERGERDENPQNIYRDGGKIYRLNDDGSIPKDNPFWNDNSAKKAIWSYGHRNPQGLTKHPETGVIWEHEHGPKGGDELNIIESGKNYGWPVITYGINYSGTKITDETHREGMEQPIHYWIPSIAPSGMTFVNSDKYPDWKGNLLVGSLSFQYLELVEMDGDKVTGRQRLMERIGRVRDVRQGPDGYIYVAVENEGIFRILP